MQDVFDLLKAHADPETAVRMAAYQRNQFPFLGIKTPVRRELTKPFIKDAKQSGVIDWDFVETAWEQDTREYQYVALDMLKAQMDLLVPDDLARFQTLVMRKSWWDTVDNMAHEVGHIVVTYPETKATMLAWSRHDDFWVRRLAILHQLFLKDQTDTALMTEILTANFGSFEFFINKAIGWALRQYSKTNPGWVREFIATHESEMTPLSIREGSKYV